MTKLRSFVLALMLAVPVERAAAQLSDIAPGWVFTDQRLFDPFRADPRAAQFNALFFTRGNPVPNLERAGHRGMWDIDVGKEIPWLGWGPTANGHAAIGRVAAGIWTPVDFHMLEDLRDPSAPILNTDYRFAGQLKVEYTSAPETYWAFKIQAGHESTHLGDEYSIVAQRDAPAQFERINVSYEYVEWAAAWSPTFGGTVPFSLRVGSVYTWKPGLHWPSYRSWYDVDAASVTSSPLVPVIASHNWTEPYVQSQVSWPDALWGHTAWLSADLHARNVYDYHRSSQATPEARQGSLNLLLGLSPPNAASVVGRVSPYLRYYHGVNPHGQFRNEPKWQIWGLGVHMDR